MGLLPSPLKALSGSSKPEFVNDSENNDDKYREEEIESTAAAYSASQSTAPREVPFLGNVSVDKSRRRQGIGGTLVKLGAKIAKKWNNEYSSDVYNGISSDGDSDCSNSVQTNTSKIIDDSSAVFVSVECDNVNALNLYKKLNFVCILDERDLINYRPSEKNRKARIFMAKSI